MMDLLHAEYNFVNYNFKLHISMKLFIRMIVSFFSIFLLVFASYGQISHGGSPFSFSLQSKSGISPQIPVIEMPFVDVDYLKTEDLVLDQIKEIPWRFGFNIDVKIDVKNHGLEQTLTDGSKLWRVEIYSPGAVSINLLFDEFQIPPGAELFIYNDSKTDVIGAFTAFNNRSDSVFATIPLRGDHITIEYYEPANPMFSGVLHLGRVTHGYRGPHDFTKAFGSSGSCNVNVACPESAGMEDQIRSAAMLVSGGNGFCSGALINNTSNNGTPYFLTADHCYANPSGVVFWFNWQSATCSNPPSSPTYQSISGATTSARYSTSDMWLMELSSSPPSNYNVYYSGWNRTMDNNISGKIWGIHHPAGDIKKISWSTLGVSTTTYLQNPIPGDGSHWRVTQWSDGTTTEGGSSGSPLFDPNGRIIGQLHGGYASCSSLTSDWYGKLGVSWTGGGTNATRLSNWLDPTNSGVTTLDGYDPNYVACSPPSNQTSGFSTSAVNDNDMTLNWTRGNGTSVMVVAREASYVNLNPTNGVNYTANPVFGSGSEIGSGNFVVYKGTGTSVTVSNLQPGITYHYALYEFFTADNCFLTPGLTANVTTTGQAPCTYCTVSASTDDNTGVTRVQFNTIDNISAGAPAYTDFTNISTSVTVGQSYDLSVWVNTDGNYTVQTRAWIDWNQNCIFDPGEEYNLGSAVNVANGLTSLSPLSITVPAGAATGQTTMRIRASYSTAPLACGNHNYSENEDYSIFIVPSCAYPVNQATNFSVTDIEDNQMKISWQRGSGTNVIVVARYDEIVSNNPITGVQYNADSVFGSGSQIGSGNYVVYNGTGTNVTVTNLLPGATYYFSIHEYFSADFCYNSPGLIGNATTTAPCVYCETTASVNNNTGITGVQFNTINNTSTGAPAYSDFTNIYTNLIVGQSYNLNVWVNTDGNSTVYTKVWIDWNNNCIFEVSEEYDLGSANNVANGLTSFSPLVISVPNGTSPGSKTMRIRTVRSSAPLSCGNQNRSETEDYSLIVLSSSCHNSVDYSGLTTNDYVWDGSVSVNWGTTANWRQYNGTGFVLPTAIPAAGNNVFIRDNGTLCTSHFPVLSDDAEITNLTIQSGASLDINPAKHLKLNGLLSVEGSITLKSNSSGTATIYDNGNISGNGIFNVEQYLPATISPARFWYMTPPVSNALSSVFNAANSTNNKVWSWNESTGTYTQITNNSTSLNSAQGYVLRLMTAPDTLLTFTGGRFNTGNTNIQLTRTDPGHVRRGYNLVGNPYPSFIDLNLISNTDVAKTVWYRSVIGGVMVFPTYNTQSGVGVLGGSRYAHPMQSFWVFLPDDNGNSYNSTLTFSNSMRVSHQGTLLKTTHSGNNILRINIEGNSSYDELVILFHSDAGVGFDNWDSEKMMNTSPSVPQLWTKESGRNLVINSMPEIIDTIPLYMTSQQAGQYIIGINMDEFDPNIDVWLQDLALGTMHNVKNGPYSFSSGVAEDNNRFVLHFSNVITGISNVNENNTSVIVFANENTIFVHTPEKGIIEVYDIVGRLVAKQNAVEGNNNIVIDDANGVFLVRVTKGHEATIKKVALW
jgi:lysyl endopeptidase